MDEIVIPVIEEELHAGVRKVVTGAVRVHKTVHEHEEVLEQPLISETAEVRRVVINRVVDGPLPPRTDGDTIIVPVVKEMLKVEKQWVLTEELHITKRRTEERRAQRIKLQHEEAEVERVDANGRRVESPPRAVPVRKNKVVK